MKTDLFHLQVLPIEDIMPHEEFDQSRAKPLVERLKKEQTLVNPILVAQINGGKYLQLDGMNRFSAFKMMGIPAILAQIVDYNDQETVELSSWLHLAKITTGDFLGMLDGIKGISYVEGRMENVGHRYIKEEGLGRICTVCSKDGRVYLVSANGNLLNKTEFLSRIVSLYHTDITRDILPAHPTKADIDFLISEHDTCSTIIVFPTFTRHQIVEVVKNGKLFPAGITRHLIKRRCLNIRVPLALFSSTSSVEEKNNAFEQTFSSRNFRVYEEPTVYFE